MIQKYCLPALLAAIALIACGADAQADTIDDRSQQIEHDYTSYVVNADGSYVETHDTAIKLLRQVALEDARNASISYSTSVQKAEVLAAYTQKPDGRRIDVPSGNFQVSSQAGQSGDSPVYSDRTTLTAVFPELAVGDTTVLSYRMTTRTPMFAGRFSLSDHRSPATYYGDVRISIDAPADLVAQHQTWQMTESAPRVADGRKVIEWRWRNRTPVDAESMRDTVFKVERYPGFGYSTFTDYAQIAEAYGARADDKATPTPRIRALADKVAGDASNQREVAKRLYEWVSRNIAYAGNCIGLGAVVPRDLDTVLDNGMGDCKDHATLLQALLTVRGIDSTQALINAGNLYTLPDVPVASMVNHVINYVPALDLYLDSTAATVPFGSLPPNDAGKPVLLVKGDPAARTPANTISNNFQRMTTTLRIQANGAVKGSQVLELGGPLAVAARSQFRDMSKTDEDKLVKRYFQQSAMRGDGTVRHDDPKPLLERFRIEADFEIEPTLPLQGGLSIGPWFISLAPVAGIVSGNAGTDDKPAGERSCGGMLSEEQYRFEFPTSMRIAAVPHDFSLARPTLTYRAEYGRDGNTVLVTRRLDDRTPGPVCTADYSTAFDSWMRDILPSLREQIVYLQADALRTTSAAVEPTDKPTLPQRKK